MEVQLSCFEAHHSREERKQDGDQRGEGNWGCEDSEKQRQGERLCPGLPGSLQLVGKPLVVGVETGKKTKHGISTILFSS